MQITVPKGISLPVTTTKLLDFFLQRRSFFSLSQFPERNSQHIFTAEKHRHSNNIINDLPITVSTRSVHCQLLHVDLIS